MTLGLTKQEFLARIRRALADRGEPVDLPDDLEVARIISTGKDVVDIFIARVEECGMHAYRVPDEQNMIDRIAELLGAAGARSVLVPQEDLPAREQIIERLRKSGITICDLDDSDAAFVADFGITAVAAAVAETGSFCVTSGNGRRRMASLAVPNHIAIVRVEQIVPDLLDWAANHTIDPPACEVLVSGPSKTSDIEMILVTGVHGPKEEHVIIVG